MRVLIFILLFLTSCVSSNRRTPHLHDTLYDRIVIELYSTTSSQPSTEALNIFKTQMEIYRICPADQIFIIPHRPSDNLRIAWNGGWLRALEAQRRTLHDNEPEDRHLTAFVAYVPGIYAIPRHHNVIGLHYDATSIAVFHRDFFNPTREAAVLAHEFGHIMGLVDRGRRPDPPINPDRPNHCNDANCVMFWQVNPIGEFDDKCQQDILNLIAERSS